MAKPRIDWIRLRSEYITAGCGMKELAEKHGVSLSAVRKRAAAEKWTQRRAAAESKREKLVENKLNERAAKKTVSDVERLIKTAGKLLAKIDKAANELDKKQMIKSKEQHEEQRVEADGDSNYVKDTVTRTQYQFERYESTINTKALNNLSKSLADVSRILAAYARPTEATESGVIEIPPMTNIDRRSEEETD